MNKTYDIIVVGGGPAGATAAGYLAQFGHEVLVIEKSVMPRHAIGESLLPSAMPLLEDLGVLEEVEAQNFPRKTGGTFIWGKDKEPWSVLFSSNPFLPYPYAYHVDRSIFDKLMLDNSERIGATVLQGWGVVDPIMKDGRIGGVIAQEGKDGERQEFHANWVIDASGRSSTLGKKLTKRTYDPQMNQVAFYSYYRNVKGPADEDIEGHVIVESHSRGWTWYIPLESRELGDVSVGVVSGAEFKEEFTESGIEKFFQDSIEECPMLLETLGPDAERVADVRAITDWAYSCDHMAGDGYFLAGDAACFLDPLLSTGVSMAMLSGYSAAICLNSIIKDPSMDGPAQEFYTANYTRMWDVTKDFLHYFYAGNANAYPEDMFWKARAQLQLGDNVGARQAFCFLVNTIPANPHPALRKQIHMFMQFMDNIEHPTEEDFSQDKQLQEMAEQTQDDYVDFSHLHDALVPEVNGNLEQSWQIDGDENILKPIRGVTYDENRPVFSTSASWLLGRNIHPLEDAALNLLRSFDQKISWGEVVLAHADREGLAEPDARKALVAQLEPLVEENIVLLRKAS